ncbi:hypothetical protein [Deinococcus navajonensis]|uniref:Leucine rich repeat variant n=1 Tax=Deinococcus navajonensis TaxID=309884 RepID=A0ABV8XUJ9_9DEIO
MRRPLLDAQIPAAMLQALADHPVDEVRAEVASHANTPAETLGRLAERFPAQVLANPALPLLRLAAPSLGQDWPPPAIQALVAEPAAPLWLLRLALTHPCTELQRQLASRNSLPADILQALARHPSWRVRAQVAVRPGLSEHLLCLMGDDPDYGVRTAVSARPDLPPDVHARLKGDQVSLVRRTLAASEQTSLALFMVGLGGC